MSMIRAAAFLAGAFYVLTADESGLPAAGNAARQSAGHNQVACDLGTSTCAASRQSWLHLEQNLEAVEQVLARLVREHVTSFDRQGRLATTTVASVPASASAPAAALLPVPSLATMRATAAHSEHLAPLRTYLMDYPSPRR